MQAVEGYNAPYALSSRTFWKKHIAKFSDPISFLGSLYYTKEFLYSIFGEFARQISNDKNVVIPIFLSYQILS